MNPNENFYLKQANQQAAQAQYSAQAVVGTGGLANYNPYIWYDSSAGSSSALISCLPPPTTPVSPPKNEKDWLRGRVDEILWRG